MKKVLLIGCGHMGNALLTSWINSKSYQLTVVDPVKSNFLKKKYKNKKIKILNNINKLADKVSFDFVVLAIKPKDLDYVLSDLEKIKFSYQTSVISIIAGKKIKLLKNSIKGTNNFFRVMPNMPASIGQSMNCLVCSKNTNKTIQNQVIKLFSYSGISIMFNNENKIDMATAISGSGPGFIFNLIDAMENAAIKLGFKKDIARILVSQTFKGSIDLLLKNNLKAKDMVKSVATKGGTTEAGLKIMNKNNIHKLFIDLTKSSFKRAKDQGKQNAKR